MKRAIVHAAALVGCATAAFAGPERGMEPVNQPLVAGGRAYVPACPNWNDANRTPSEAQASNFGCATASNLAAMIADPQDLLHGRQAAGPDAESATKAIKAWRAAAPSGGGGARVEQTSSKGGS